MTAVTSPPARLPTDDAAVPPLATEPSQAVTAPAAAAPESLPAAPKPSQAVRPSRDSLTIGQAARLIGLHKNTIRTYIKQGRLAAQIVRGKYGQEYRLSRADVVALADQADALSDPGMSDALAPTPELEPLADATTSTRTPSLTSQPSSRPSNTDDPLGIPEIADESLPTQPTLHSPSNLSLEPLAGLLRQVQEENRNLAGQLGFVQAQLQQAKETIRLLQAPPEMIQGDEDTVADEMEERIAAAEEIGRLKAELEQAQQRVAEYEAVTDELERAQAAEAAEATSRPWWRFWG
jgi:excisionase family DNA binding protein